MPVLFVKKIEYIAISPIRPSGHPAISQFCQPFLAAMFVTIAMVKVKLMSDLYIA